MQRALNHSVQQSLANLERVVSSLTSLCGCGFCNDQAYRCLADTHGECEDSYCVVVTAMTIASLVRLVAGLKIHGTISPTVSGLQHIYRQCDQRVQLNGETRRSVPALGDVLGLKPAVDSYYHLSPGYLIRDVQCLFTGFPPYSKTEQGMAFQTASSINGICCFIEALQGLSSNAAVLRRIHVLPGRIQKGDREYSEVTDSDHQVELPLPRAKLSRKSITPPANYREDNGNIKIKALVRENTNGSALEFTYEAAFEGTMARIYPGHLTQRILCCTGLITCSQRACGKSLTFPCSVISEGWGGIPYTLSREEQPSKCLIWPFRENDIGRCIAVGTAGVDEVVYVRKGECLPCCTKSVINEPFSVIV